LPQLARMGKVFPLHEMLMAVSPDVVDAHLKAYAASKNPLIQVEDLTHFALGIFWKASVHLWRYGPSPSNVCKIELGPDGENIRQFLWREAPFPKHVALGVNVMPPPVTTRLSLVPREGIKSDSILRFNFYIPGILFALFVGRGVTGEIKEGCFYSNPAHPILVEDLSEEIEERPKAAYFKAKAAMAERRENK
jgi:hypothetical protein